MADEFEMLRSVITIMGNEADERLAHEAFQRERLAKQVLIDTTFVNFDSSPKLQAGTMQGKFVKFSVPESIEIAFTKINPSPGAGGAMILKISHRQSEKEQQFVLSYDGGWKIGTGS